MMTKKILSAIILYASFSLAGIAYGMPAPECSKPGALTAMADIVVEGTIEGVEAKKDERGFIYTYVDVSVSRYVKGQGDKLVMLKIPGGCAEGLCTDVSGVPDFYVGQEGYLCLMIPPYENIAVNSTYYPAENYARDNFYYPVCGQGVLKELPGQAKDPDPQSSSAGEPQKAE